MNIGNFEKNIESKILSRGRNYFRGGYISSLESDDGSNWIAEVSGSEDYDYVVTVEISESGDIISSSCDCPYDYGSYCKHQTAVFYAIRESGSYTDVSSESTTDIGKKKKKSKTEISFEEALNKIEKRELTAFLTKYASEDKRFKSEFMLNFADKFITKSQISTYARNLIKSSFTGLVRNGYIQYSDRPKMVRGAQKVLQMAEDETDRYTALTLCTIILEEMLSISYKYQDAYQHCYREAEKAMKLMGEIFAKCNESDSDSIKFFDLILSHVSDDRIYGSLSELRMGILEMFVPMCHIKYVRDKLEEYLDKWCRNISGSYASKHVFLGSGIIVLGNIPPIGYREKSIQDLQYRIISTFDGEESARKFVEAHTENDKFRSLAIEYAVSEENYDKAIELCLDGEKKDAGYPRYAEKWKKARYDIYGNTGNIAERKKIAHEFIISGDFDFYPKLRELYSIELENFENPENSDEFFDVLENLLSELKEAGLNSVYTKVLIHEKMKPELLEYCRDNISSITEFYRHLVPDYQEEVETVFLEYLHRKAKEASSRSQYSEVCSIIREYAKLCGTENADKIIESFVSQYNRRPAFVDELNKIRRKLIKIIK